GFECGPLGLGSAPAGEVGHPRVHVDAEHPTAGRLELPGHDAGAATHVEHLGSGTGGDDRPPEGVRIARPGPVVAVRIRAERLATCAQLFDAAERVLLRDGPSALTSRAKGVLHRHFDDFDAFLAEFVLDRAERLRPRAADLLDSAGTGTVAGYL